MNYEFNIPGRPVPKGRPRRSPQGHWYTPTRTVNYEKEVLYEAKRAGVNLSSDRWYSIEVTVYVVSFSRMGDRDNIVKSILDGLRHLPGFDDRQFNSLLYRERGVEDAAQEHTRVLIEDNGPRKEQARDSHTQGTLV